MKDFEQMATRLERFLFTLRSEGKHKLTYDEVIAEAAKRKPPVILEKRSVREMMNYLKKNKRPVGSSTSGVWAILHSSEFDEVIDELVSRARDIEEQIKAMKEAREDLWKRENALKLQQAITPKETTLFEPHTIGEHPMVKELKEQFKTEEVKS
jgi:hypothetical protein